MIPAATVTTLPAASSPDGASPSPRVGAATAVLSDKIYLFSGRGGTAMAPIDESGRLWVFTPSSSTWEPLSPSFSSSSGEIPAARSYHTMTASPDHGTLYVHAGCPASGRLADLWSFTLADRTWKQLASAPAPARGGASITYAEGRLWRMNGFDGEKEQGGRLDVYDIATDSWSSISFAADGKEGPGARSVAALVPVRGHEGGGLRLVTLFGESDPSSLGHMGAGKMLADVWVFEVEKGTWARVQAEEGREVPQGRGWFDADVVKVDGKEAVVVVGGLGESNERLDDAWVLTL